MSDPWRGYADRIEQLAVREGLSYFPVDFERVPDSFMMEIAIYGLPVRMPHWSFGVRYMHQLLQRRMGHSRIFEVMFPGNPGRAYLSSSNGLPENLLVVAHVLGHADFSRNNSLFAASQEQVGYHIVEQAAGHARRIADAIDEYGQQRVEALLDAALALEQHIDVDKALQRPRYAEFLEPHVTPNDDFAPARAGTAASGARPVVVPRQLCAGARRLGARRTARGTRGVVLLLPSVRLPDHERRLGLLLACPPAARSRFPAGRRLR
jgi:stage V sporulation protein R